jgi:chromosome partitioning protein
MRKLAIALSKGGVGKTTTAVNLAAGLSQAGSRVLLVDTDTQGQTSVLLGCQPAQGLAEVLGGVCPVDTAVIEARPRLWLLAGGQGLAGVTRLIARKDFGGEHTLRECLAAVDGHYDYVLQDTAPGWDALTVNGLFYAEDVIAPVALEVLAFRGLVEFEQRLTAMQPYHARLTLRYIVPTFLDRRVKKSLELLEQLQAHYGPRLCPPIRYNVRLAEAPGYGQTIGEYAPDSPGAADYHQLTERIRSDGHTTQKNA